MSRYTEYKPNNVSNFLKHLRTHEHDERIIAVREEPNLHCVLPEMSRKECGHPGNLLLDSTG